MLSSKNGSTIQKSTFVPEWVVLYALYTFEWKRIENKTDYVIPREYSWYATNSGLFKQYD